MTGAILVLLLAGTPSPGAAAGPSPADACRLLTPGEIVAVTGGRLAETKPTRRAAGDLAISDCFYRSQPFEDSVSLELARPARASDPTIRDRWNAMFNAEKDERDESDARGSKENATSKGKEKDSPPQPIEGLGDAAFWIANPASGVLYVLKGDAYLRISVGGSEEEGVKQRKAAALARKALKRL